MREFEFTFDEGFTTGLKPFSNVPRNAKIFEVLKGARVGKAGLEPIESLIPAFEHSPPVVYPDLSPDWPFPQYFYGMNRRAIGLRNTFYELLIDGTFVPVIIDIDNVLSNDLWSVGDFGLYQLVMKDGTLVVERAGDTGIWTKSLVHTTIPLAKTVCNFKGQGVVGNFTFPSCTEAGQSYIGWSDIGSINFALDRKGTAGYKHAEFNGPIYEVKQLGNGVMIYGQDGIGYLRAVTSPMATFGYIKLAGFGIANKGAVNGNELIHSFVSSEGDLYKVSYENNFPAVEMLGYKHLLATTSTIIVSFVPGSNSEGMGEFYIGDGSYCYLLSSYGLSQTNQIISSATRVAGQAVGFFTQEEDTSFECVTNVIDFGFRAHKTIFTIEVGCSGSGTYEVAIDYRNAPNEPFNTTQYVPINNQGIATLICGGIEFRLRLAYDEPSDIDISYMKVRYKADDLRGIRGIYAKG